MATGCCPLLMLLMVSMFVVFCHADVKGAYARKAVDCQDLITISCEKHETPTSGHDGSYTIYFGDKKTPLTVQCDMTTDGGGWTVFQRRRLDAVDFNRNWTEYKRGFGNSRTSFWLGNEHLHLLTEGLRQVLRVDMEDWKGNKLYAEYDNFAVGSEGEKYKIISIGNYSGNADDALQYHKGMEFSTKDRDNDIYAGSCAERWKGGWWFSRCYRAYMNGDFRKGSTSYGVWQGSKGKVYWLKSAEMKIRTYSAKTSK